MLSVELLKPGMSQNSFVEHVIENMLIDEIAIVAVPRRFVAMGSGRMFKPKLILGNDVNLF